MPGRSVAVIVPAKDEAARIAATVRAVQQIPEVALVVVVDDASRDDTAVLAEHSGAEVVRHERRRGKAAALQTGADYVGRHTTGDPPAALLFVDADLQDSAAGTAALVEPVLSGAADMTIAVLPPQASPGGGHGFVVRLARRGIGRATGWTPTQPLSGMRCLTPDAFEAARPLARGWGAEVGLSIDVLRQGGSVQEVPCDLQHRVTGTDLRAQAHRIAQYRDVWLALLTRRRWRRPQA